MPAGPNADGRTTLRFTGASLAQARPGLLADVALRSAAAGAPDPFLPDGRFEVRQAFDLTPAARSSAAATAAQVPLDDGDVVVLETVDGEMLVTSGRRLRDELARGASDGVAGDAVDLDRVTPPAGAQRSFAGSLGQLFTRVFTLAPGPADAIVEDALGRLRERGERVLADRLAGGLVWGASAIATRALMWAIEKRLARAPGLYRWTAADEATGLQPLDAATVAREAAQGPVLVFLHGTASSSLGSFSALRADDADARRDWARLAARYGERVYALEHRTLSESPIENALQLVEALPPGVRIDLVTHSRGGLVGDLVAADWSDPERSRTVIASLRRFRLPHQRDDDDLEAADRRDREDLQRLADTVRAKGVTVGRYVRVAAPAAGTSLAGSNLDLVLSVLLRLIGTVPFLAGTPYYAAFRRVVLEVARNRTDANRIPGLEAMLPGSSLARVLRLASPQPGVRIGVVAGDIEDAPGLRRLVEFLADWTIFSRGLHDLVVDSSSMLAGLARPAQAARRFVQGPAVSHFAYFRGADSRAAAAGWLLAVDGAAVEGFAALDDPLRPVPADAAGASRGGDDDRPLVIVLPGTMGSHLAVHGDRVWLDPLDLASGGLRRLAWDDGAPSAVQPQDLFDGFYGDLCRWLGRTHEVVRFPYDWRLPVQREGARLAAALRQALDATRARGRPVRILAHSMGGLVARAAAAADPSAWDELLSRPGARFVMMGTPNRGSHDAAVTLLGKGEAVRQLAMLDPTQDLQAVLDVVAGFRGALQLLPRPGWSPDGTPAPDWLDPAFWVASRAQVRDFWFGDGRVALPDAAACAEARALWSVAGFDADRVPGPDPSKVVYVCGWAERTASGLVRTGGQLKLQGSPEGDGTVLWASGRIDGIGSAYLMEVDHGDLMRADEHFDAIGELLHTGATTRLVAGWPSMTVRSGRTAPPAVFDAGPATVPADEDLAAALVGARPRRRRREPAARMPLSVSCAAMDLRWVRDPVLVGHYVNDPLAGAEAAVDRHVVCGELAMRSHLGLYPGPLGTALAVLLPGNDEEQRRGQRLGAVVTGLGELGQLSASNLTEAVKVGVLRYLLAAVEAEGAVGTAGDGTLLELGLATVLVGYNSTANIAIPDSLRALIQGVVEANRLFAHARTRGRPARVVRLQVVERYLDVAISAAKALPGVCADLQAEHAAHGLALTCGPLQQGAGMRPRLEAADAQGYWPRLIVTAPDPRAAGGAASVVDGGRALGRQLRFVYLAQRARAEADGVQTQPELVQRLVAQAVADPRHPKALAQALFQLLVPPDFKEAARQSDRLYLLVDAWTANFPWEMLRSDDRPLVARTAVVRQFDTTDWRRRVRTAVERSALVIGNPSSRGFAAAFGLGGGPDADPPPLPAAEREAIRVATVLRASDYRVQACIGQDVQAVQVFEALFAQPYRIVHIAAHGEHDHPDAAGERRSGVLLSDGVMLTAAEIRQMEFVPELVFLNCCHLGSVDAGGEGGRSRNLLAASLARALIDLGVRAVVVAGWAVDDAAAQRFAEVFYERFLQARLPFGLAVHAARGEVLRQHADTNTWGAFQAYGDPDYRMDPGEPMRGGGGVARPFVAHQELLDALDALRDDLAASTAARAADPCAVADVEARIAALMTRVPPGADWARRPDVLHALGSVHAARGPAGFTAAVERLRDAIGSAGRGDAVPLRAVETLANLLARRTDADGAGAEGDALLREALSRLLALSAATGAGEVPDAALGALEDWALAMPADAITPERCSLLGSTWKRRAARVAAGDGPLTGADRARLVKALDEARRWYAAGDRGDGDADHGYAALNAMLLQVLLGSPDTPRPDLAERAGRLAAWARQRLSLAPDFWLAVMPADASVVEAIALGTLDAPATREATARALAQAYRDSTASTPAHGRERDSVRQMLVQAGRFARALGRPGLGEALVAVADGFEPPAGTGAATAAAPAAATAVTAAPAAPRRRRPPDGPPAAARRRTKPAPEAPAAPAAAVSRSATAGGPIGRFFSLAELTASGEATHRGIDNQPGPEHLANLRALCVAVLDPLRESLGVPIKVTSGYRSPALNAAVGGSATSQHALGQAADLQVSGRSALDVFKHIVASDLPFDQVIYEDKDPKTKWVHVSHDPKRARREIRVAVFTNGKPTGYPMKTREQALAMSEPVTRSRRVPTVPPGHEELDDEPPPRRGRRR